MQWLAAKGVGAVDLNLCIQQVFQYILVRVEGRQMQSCLSILILGIEIPIAALEQLEDDLALVFACGAMQQIGHSVAASVVRRQIADQGHRQLGGQTVGRLLIVVDERVQAVQDLRLYLVVDGEEGVLAAMSPHLVVTHLTLAEQAQHKVPGRCAALAHQKCPVLVTC